MALSRLSKKPLKSHVSSAFLEDMDFAEQHHGASPLPELRIAQHTGTWAFLHLISSVKLMVLPELCAGVEGKIL